MAVLLLVVMLLPLLVVVFDLVGARRDDVNGEPAANVPSPRIVSRLDAATPGSSHPAVSRSTTSDREATRLALADAYLATSGG